jgi:electron-transferring-flavoprotein dehydrogenase
MHRDELAVDVLFVGAGPANLSAAIHLARTLQAKGMQKEIVVIEKSQRVGGHILSGAVMDPIALAELFPDWRSRGCPIEAEVTDEEVYLLFEKHAMRLPLVPPPLKNHGLNRTRQHSYTQAASCENAVSELSAVLRASTAAVTSGV